MLDKETKRRIFTSLLKQAPPGEFNAVFDDIRTMHHDAQAMDEQCATTLIDYNHENFLPVTHPELKDTLVTKYNLVNSNYYLEPKSNKLFAYDHVQRNVTEVVPNTHEIDSELNAWREALQEQLDHYISDHFQKNGTGSVFIYEGNAIVCIASHNYQRRNCYNGRWCSFWTIPAFSTKRAVHAVTGSIQILTHYYEDGNVQMNSNKSYTLNVAYPVEIQGAAKEVLKSIIEAEASHLVSVHEKFSTMSEQTFKTLRRTLPVTRTKMDWHKALAYRVPKSLPSANSTDH